MEYVLGVVDTIKSWSISLFLFFGFFSLFNLGWALAVLKIAIFVLFAFCCYDVILIIVTTIQLFTDPNGILGIIGTVIEWLTLIAAIAIIVIFSMASANSELVIFQGDNSNLIHTFFFVCSAMILRNWVQEILTLPISLIGIFLGDD